MALFRYRQRRRAQAVASLRRATFALPQATRESMLASVREEKIIVGSYTSRAGGMCPMLAAHRGGTRSDALAFASAWDAVGRARRPRPATRRELDVLLALLEESIDISSTPSTAPPAPHGHGHDERELSRSTS